MLKLVQLTPMGIFHETEVKKPQLKEEDHEVSMAQSSLDAIIRYSNELKQKIGNKEKDIPAWIQDHIAKAESYIQQSANHYHEYGGESGKVNND